MTSAVERTAAEVVALARSRPPTLGGARLLCVDGPAGSGKTTLANAVRDHLHGTDAGPVRRVHLDDLYPGWDGVTEAAAIVHEGLLVPLAAGRAGRYRRYDWIADRLAEEQVVEPAPWIVLEGVGSGALRYAPLVTVLVWVSADDALRLRRGLERDGQGTRGAWERWMSREGPLFEAERTHERADVVVDAYGSLVEDASRRSR